MVKTLPSNGEGAGLIPGQGAKSQTRLSDFTFMHWRRKWQPTPVFLPGESQGWRSLWAAIYGVAQSPTWVKRLSSSSIASLVTQMVKNLPAMWETWVRSLGWEDPLEKGMATHSSILAWRIPGTGEPGRLQSTGSQRVGHDWLTKYTYI